MTHAGGQLWISSFDTQRLDLAKQTLVEDVAVVDDKTLLTILALVTIVLNF